MIERLLKLKSFLPAALARPLLTGFWRRFWAEEGKQQARLLGLDEEPILAGSERAVLTEALVDCFPFGSVLEVGAAFGQNFHTLATLFPDVPMLGVDRDSLKVREGRELLKQAGLENVELKMCDALELERFPAQSFDLVYTSACLLEVPPEQIEAVLRGMFFVAKKAVVLLEQHLPVESAGPEALLGLAAPRENGPRFWLRDYFQLLAQFVPKNQIEERKLRRALWSGERWEDCGRVFVARI